MKSCITTPRSFNDWPALYDDNANIDSNVFTDTIVPSKTMTIFPNNKPWLKKYLKKRALSGDRNQVREIQKRLNAKISSAKKEYKDKIEYNCKTNNLKVAWQGLKQLCGYQTKPKVPEPSNAKSHAGELNTFFARFDAYNFFNEPANLRVQLSNNNDRRMEISLAEVRNSLNRVKTYKAFGPDNVGPIVLKSCAEQLISLLHTLFQASLDQSKLLIPKKQYPKVNNVCGS